MPLVSLKENEPYFVDPGIANEYARKVAGNILTAGRKYREIVCLQNGLFLSSVLSRMLDIRVQTFRHDTDIHDGIVTPVVLPLHTEGTSGGGRLITTDVLRLADELKLIKEELPEADIAAMLTFEHTVGHVDYTGYVVGASAVSLWYENQEPEYYS